MKRVAQAPSHYEVELRQPEQQDERTGAAWRAVRRIGANGIVPLKFASSEAAQAHAARLGRRETRIVAVERDGWRRTVGAEEA
jgi:hypothetical protein